MSVFMDMCKHKSHVQHGTICWKWNIDMFVICGFHSTLDSKLVSTVKLKVMVSHQFVLNISYFIDLNLFLCIIKM